MNIFGFKIMPKSEYHELIKRLVKKQATIIEQQDHISALTEESKRLLNIEKKYKKLTDRDEKGRFVKREVEADNG